MSRKIVGVTVGTPMNPQRIAEKIEGKYGVKTVNGIKPDENGNVEIQTGACLPDEKIAELMSALQ